MASLRTGMRAGSSSFSITNLSTRMREKISVNFRVEMFPTEAVVFGHRLVVFKIALRTFPVEDVKRLLELLLIDVFDPLFYASQVH